MNDEMKDLVLAPCGHKEYYGMVYWHNGKRFCRKCIYEIWKKESKWKPSPTDYVFPLYDDGVNYE